ncbi:hypothetical protein [Bacteroides graminisolvens]|uniref:Uncharacterized protein n=1 Tax=Bacteroides graminisolvens DSM 19988 = JCM 15093 TaxID=1121097 RepID=A0A069D6D1_9BACE|nr:hypothetical protein [Bacteroides graminisolvens]GAK37962.1 hypothetical protein JCM15093_3253 [Bacteroides graminisolvens DSM 19988 = JCM 15093]
MGIKNKNNAMYFATGIDNSGLSEDAEQGKKIVRDMTDDIVAEGSKMRDAFAKAGTGVVSITDKIKELKIGINQTEADIKTLQNTFENAAPGKAKMFALQELEAAKKVLQEDKIALQDLETQMKKTSTGPISLRTQIRNLKEEMALMTEESEGYEAAMKKLGDLMDKQGDIATQGKIFADDEKGIRTAVESVNLFSGALTAGMGAVSLFGMEEEKLAAIQTRLQSVMAITIGLQQVATSLNKDSYVRRILLVKADNLLTAANTRLAVSLGISNVAAKALMATLTLGLTVAIGGLIYLWDKYSSRVSYAAERQKQSQEQISNAVNSVSSTVADQMVTLYNLIKRWDALGDNLKKKKKFIEESKDEFHNLGLSVNTVNEAENALVRNTNSVIKAMQLRAQAAAYQKIAQEEYEKMARAELKAQFIENSAPTEEDYRKVAKTKGGLTIDRGIDMSDTANAEANRSKRANQFRVEARMHLIWGNHVMKSTDDLNKQLSDEFKKAGIVEYNGSDTYKQEQDAARKAKEEANKKKIADAERTKQIIESNQKIKETLDQGEIDLWQSRIDRMDEGYAKQKARIALNYDKMILEIRNKEKEMLKAQQEVEKLEWQTKNPDWEKKGLVFKPTTIKISQLPENSQKQLVSMYSAAYGEREKAESDLLNSLLEKHQDYDAKRRAIEKEYNDDILALQLERQAILAKGDKDELAKIDSAIANATTEKGKALMQNSYEMLKQSPDYIRAFEDLKNTSSDTLMSLVDQFEAVKDSAAASLNPEDLREYTNTIRELMDELDSRNPFKALADRKKELIDAERELIIAQKQLDAVRNGAKIVTGVKSLKLDNGKIKAENVYLSASEALAKYNKAKEKANEANNNFQKAEKASLEKVDGLANALSNLGGTIEGTSGEIISLIGDVGSFTTEVISGITNVSQKGAGVLLALEKASVILTILQAGIQLMRSLNSILPDAYNEYEKYAAKIEEINKLTDAVNDYKIAVLEANNAESGWFSEDNLKNLRDYKEVQEAVWDAYIDKVKEAQAVYQNQSGGGWITNPWNSLLGVYDSIYGTSIFGHDYEKGTTAAINNLRIETRKKSKGFLGSGIGGKSQKTEDLQTWINENKDKFKGLDTNLFDKELNLNTELAKSILDNYGDKLVGQTKDTLEALMELQEKYDEYLEQLHEYVSTLYEPLVNNFVDSIWDWFDEGKNALDSFKEYASSTFRDIVSDMLKSIVLDKVVGSFSDDIANVYEEYAKGNINESQLMKKVSELTKVLVGNYETNIPTLENILKEVNSYLSNAGIDLSTNSSTEKGVTGKLEAALTEGTASEVLGVMNMSALDIRALKEMSADHYQNYAETMNYIFNILDETRQINENTKRTADNTDGLIDKLDTGFKDLKSELTEIKKNTKDTSGR